VKERMAAGLERIKRTDTAELRRRYDEITSLLRDGYNHKQICGYLNEQGLAIPYPQYRAIMTRLRGEKNSQADLRIFSNREVMRVMDVTPAPINTDPVQSTEKPDGIEAQKKRILWNPMSEVKWK
jgi:hypothetical protein